MQKKPKYLIHITFDGSIQICIENQSTEMDTNYYQHLDEHFQLLLKYLLNKMFFDE